MSSELQSGIHLLTFSETWAHKDTTDAEFEIHGYQLFRRDRGSTCKGGGLACYSRNDLSYEELISRTRVLRDYGWKYVYRSLTVFWLEIFVGHQPHQITQRRTFCLYSMVCYNSLQLKAKKSSL